MKEENSLPIKKSLREILPKGTARAPRRMININSNTHEDIGHSFPEEAEPILESRRMSKMPKFVIWGIGGLFLILLFIIGSSFFTTVKVVVVPKQVGIAAKDDFTAVKDASADQLEFGTITNAITETVTVPATGSEKVERKASGQITIYNNYSESSQKLVANTRFETADGQIYRIKDEVSVPGTKTVAGKTEPGSLTATVYADKTGDGFNIGLTDFTIPGFKGSDRFDKFYARSKTAMAGGFIGTVKTVSEADKKQAETELKAKLTEKSKDNTGSGLQIPDGYILFDDALFSNFQTEVDSTNTGSDQAKIVGKLVYTGVLFNKATLAKFLASFYIQDYKNEPVTLAGLDKLKFTIKDKESINPQSVTSISFNLTGDGLLVWDVDEEALKKAIAGFSKSNYQIAIGDFTAIESINLKFIPPWVRKVPEDLSKITVRQLINNDK